VISGDGRCPAGWRGAKVVQPSGEESRPRTRNGEMIDNAKPIRRWKGRRSVSRPARRRRRAKIAFVGRLKSFSARYLAAIWPCPRRDFRRHPTAGYMTHVARTLTAENRDQLRNPTLGSRVYGLPVPFYLAVSGGAPMYLGRPGAAAAAVAVASRLGQLGSISSVRLGRPLNRRARPG